MFRTLCTKGKRMNVLLQQKNMKRIAVLVLVLMWAWSLMATPVIHPGDSVGLKTQGESSFIVYKISAGETVFSVCRRYEVTFASVVAANPGVDMDKVNAGQVILVPRSSHFSAEKEKVHQPTKKEVTASNTGSTHIVKDGETMYSISREYDVDFSSLLDANPQISDFNIQAGQVINLPSGTLASVNTTQVQNAESSYSAPAEITAPKENPGEEQQNTMISQDNNMLITDGKINRNKSFAQVYAEYSASEYIPHADKGVATWIEGSSEFGKNSERLYALHNNAPIGSVIKVRNLMNNRVIYAKVIGTLSDSEVESKVLVKLSAGAADQLNVLDNRFVAEINFFTVEEEAHLR